MLNTELRITYKFQRNMNLINKDSQKKNLSDEYMYMNIIMNSNKNL